MDPETRQFLYALAKECGGFKIKEPDGSVTEWIWDREHDRPRKLQTHNSPIEAPSSDQVEPGEDDEGDR